MLLPSGAGSGRCGDPEALVVPLFRNAFRWYEPRFVFRGNDTQRLAALTGETLTRVRVACREAAQDASLTGKQRQAFQATAELAELLQPSPHLRDVSRPQPARPQQEAPAPGPASPPLALADRPAHQGQT